MALLVAADFPGNLANRALAYGSLAVNGTILITLGTWAALNPWIAVPLCFMVGALVSFLGLLSEIIAAGQRVEEARLARSVATDETDPLTRLDAEARVLEEGHVAK